MSGLNHTVPVARTHYTLASAAQVTLAFGGVAYSEHSEMIVQPQSMLNNGDYNLCVVVEDVVGLRSNNSKCVSFHVQHEAPQPGNIYSLFVKYPNSGNSPAAVLAFWDPPLSAMKTGDMKYAIGNGNETLAAGTASPDSTSLSVTVLKLDGVSRLRLNLTVCTLAGRCTSMTKSVLVDPTPSSVQNISIVRFRVDSPHEVAFVVAAQVAERETHIQDAWAGISQRSQQHACTVLQRLRQWQSGEVALHVANSTAFVLSSSHDRT